jgi:DNA (cytosine-5)-methyltransferase 1
LNELALFAGAGGGILGGHLLGWRTVCAVEWEPYAASVLAARQNDGILPPFPIWDDIQTFDGRPWRGRVDVVSGGFPCQDISAAGKGAGIDGERSGMWREMARVVSEVRPRYVYVENSPMLTTRGGTRVIADLTEIGYDAQWDVMGAADVGAPHQRDRIWIVAYTNSAQCQRNERSERAFAQHANTCRTSWWDIEPNVGRVADGVAAKVDRLKAIGNGQVPAVAATAFNLLKEKI